MTTQILLAQMSNFRYQAETAPVAQYMAYGLCWFPVAMYLSAAVNASSAIAYANVMDPNSGNNLAEVSEIGKYGA
jgi:hypothetical protein